MDCNRTIDFSREFKRMCGAQDECEHCPLNVCLDDCCFGGIRSVRDLKRAIKIVQKWSDEHPQKTYSQDFLKSFRTQ